MARQVEAYFETQWGSRFTVRVWRSMPDADFSKAIPAWNDVSETIGCRVEHRVAESEATSAARCAEAVAALDNIACVSVGWMGLRDRTQQAVIIYPDWP
jgi:hypothetical protein